MDTLFNHIEALQARQDSTMRPPKIRENYIGVLGVFSNHKVEMEELKLRSKYMII
ncbi:SubName: Full=Uncharacterized protein {ECO:0000313/EMBL:CCA71729.1} [Serendipita indica DSM 11827]|nr:SubName: Full=Uncharacterized protein {ECO:0000313/EMBL:CCA71729.1} [Serendipita indica DSM 11827]